MARIRALTAELADQERPPRLRNPPTPFRTDPVGMLSGRMTQTFQGIVPPFLLERIATSSLQSAPARHTLRQDLALRIEREQAQPTGRLMPRLTKPKANRTISDAENTTTLPGRQVRAEGEPEVVDESVNEAYEALGATWELLLDEFGRDSLDGVGRPLEATVHYGSNYDNAFWNGERMVFGDGDGEIFGSFTSCIDIVGHELGHGVIESTAALIYRNQPGALNESIADVLGVLTKQFVLGHTAAEADWLIGAGLFLPGVNGVALRSMAAPGTAYDDPVLGRDPQPAHMADYVNTTDDNGGVHINSGIPNKAFHDLALALGGFAFKAPGRIWLDALSNTSPSDDFATFAATTITSASRLFGDASPEASATTQAWVGVGVTPAARGDVAADPAIEVIRTGGLVGRTVRVRLNPSLLDAEDAEFLARVASDASLNEQPATVHPDDYTWLVRLATGESVTACESEIPADALARLRRLVRQPGTD